MSPSHRGRFCPQRSARAITCDDSGPLEMIILGPARDMLCDVQNAKKKNRLHRYAKPEAIAEERKRTVDNREDSQYVN